MKQWLIYLSIAAWAATAPAQQKGIINNAASSHVKLKSINIGDCRWTDGFWGDKFKRCEEVMVPHMGGTRKGDIGFAYDNFTIAAGIWRQSRQVLGRAMSPIYHVSEKPRRY